jgi:hypothetical protein
MNRIVGWYGANPLHLLALVGCFALAGYAAVRLVSFQPIMVVVWFLGAVIGHDLLLFPLYSVADRAVLAILRHQPTPMPTVSWINYVRVPAFLSGLLFLVWFPLILRLPAEYALATTLSPKPFLYRWLAVTAVLWILSAFAFAARLRRAPPEPPLMADRRLAGRVPQRLPCSAAMARSILTCNSSRSSMPCVKY